MTLIIAMHNSKDIVVISDSVATVDLDGKRLPSTHKEKILTINSKALLAFAGKLTDASLQFIKYFVHSSRSITDIEYLKSKLLDDLQTLLPIKNQEKIDICLLGYKEGKPQIKTIKVRNRNQVNVTVSMKPYHVMGYDNPGQEVVDALNLQYSGTPLATSEIKNLLKRLLNDKIEQYQDSIDEPLGGPILIKTLRS